MIPQSGKIISILAPLLLLLMLFLQMRGQFVGLQPPLVFRKDLIATYVLAKAVFTGTNPYLIVDDLASQFIPESPYRVFPHPAPHSPVMVLAFLPFALLSYQQAAVCWWLAEIVFLTAAMILLLRQPAINASVAVIMGVVIFALMWEPLWDDLLFGQFNLLLLLFLVFAWRALRKEKLIQGGLFLGGIVGLKLMLWPVALHLLLKRRWRVIVASAVMIGLLNLLAVLAMGIERVSFYYREVGRIVAPLYQSHMGNFALWTIGWRTFEGVKGVGKMSVYAPPLIYHPQSAPFLSALILMLWLAGSLWMAHRMRNSDLAFAVMICASLFVNPVAWSHYLTLLILPVMISAMFLKEPQLRKKNLPLTFVTALLLLIPRSFITDALISLSTSFHLLPDGTTVPQVSFTLGLLTYLPVIAVMSLMLLLWRLDRQTGSSVTEVQPRNL